MTEPAETALRIARKHKLAEEWALVLVAEGLSPTLRRERGRFVVSVPDGEAERGAEALETYERENAPEPDPDAHAYPDTGLALLIAGALVSFFLMTGARDPASPWFERGSAEASRILAGEAWRAVTALTLHADLGHVASNAVAGGLFFGAVFRGLGPGVGLLAVLLAGFGGNLLNAAVQGPPHASMGASTAVFGAVGLLVGVGVARRRRTGARGRRALLPVAAGLALIAMLGTGERVDLWAHLFGFLVGGALGVVVTPALRRALPAFVQWSLAGLALASVLACWVIALSA